MFKKALAILIASSLLLSATVISTSATETKKDEETAVVKTITPVIKNNITTYYDQDGNEVDITADNKKINVDKSELPETYDLRDYGRSTSVKDQGTEGFCWNFASTASVESSILSTPELRAELGENAEQTLDLSEVGNAWYVHTNIDDTSSHLYGSHYNNPGKGSQGGGDQCVANGLSSGFGTYPEELMPYSEWGNHFSESLRFYSDYRLKEYIELENDVNLIKQRLMDYGAICFSYSNYQGNYNMVNEMQSYYDNGSSVDGSDDSSHASVLVGWDDNFSKENFVEGMRPKYDGAWLVKNSWGTEYGSQAEGYEGYFWMSYETNLIGLSQYVMQGVDEFDNIYQNQFIGMNETNVISAANVFTAEKDEVLEQICFSNVGAEEITFEVYKLNDDYTSPTDGVLLTSFEDSVNFTGIHCIDVPNQVELSAGDIFSIVLKSNDTIYISNSNEVVSKDNISFAMLSDGNWEDITQLNDIGYVFIKAYTSNKNGAVYKDELSQLVDEVENLDIDENISQTIKDEINSELEKAKQVLSDNTASQNTVDNTYCLLGNAVDKLNGFYYEINNIDDFITLSEESFYGKYSEAYITLNVDLDFSDHNLHKLLFSDTVPFSGVFDGNGHTISNLKFDNDDNNGLFSEIQNAEIKNLNIDNCVFTSKNAVGAIANKAYNSSITNCTVTNLEISSVTRASGGILSYAEDSSITNCTVADSRIVSKNDNASGLIGYSSNISFKDCNVLRTEVIGYNAAIAFSNQGETQNFENCVANDITLKASSQIEDDNGSVVYNYTESPNCVSFLVYENGKYTLEPCVGTITDVSSEEAIVTKSDEKYEVDLNGNSEVYLNVSYEELDTGSFSFEVDVTTNEIVLTGYDNFENESETEIVFPSNIAGLPVASLDDYFSIYSVAPVESITFLKTIDNMRVADFSDFADTLKTVNYAEGIEYIDRDNFPNVESVVTINLPDSLESIGNSAFDMLPNLENVRFGKNLKEIGNGAFFACTNLTSIVLPESVESIGKEAFMECGSLSVVLGENVKEIGEKAFGYTDKIIYNEQNVEIPDFTVIGYTGTSAETYANDNGFTFVDASSQEVEIPQGYFDYNVFLSGDVNLDGRMSIADATLIQKYLVNKAELNKIQKYNARFGYSKNELSINDATIIQKKLVGITVKY